MDTDVQETLLQKLNEYGDSFIGAKSDRRKKKKLKRKVLSDNTETVDTSGDIRSREESLEGTTEQLKKKKRKKLTAHDESSEFDVKQSVVGKTGQDKQIEQMKEQLGLKEFVRENNKGKTLDRKQKPVKNVDVVVFQSHKSKRKLKGHGGGLSEATDGPEFDMKQARFDVRKLGIKGFQGTQKKEAMSAYLMQLGARPEKNTFINYKKFQRKRKFEMEEERKKKELDRKLGYKVKKPERDRKRPTDKNDIGHLDGQVGKFKRGTLFVDKDMLKKMK